MLVSLDHETSKVRHIDLLERTNIGDFRAEKMFNTREALRCQAWDIRPMIRP